MAEGLKRVRRKRRVRSLPGAGSIHIFRRRVSPEYLALIIAAIALALVLAIIGATYGSKFYNSWQESRLLKRASNLLEQHDYEGATRDAKRSKPDQAVWVLRCSNSNYRVSRTPDMAAKVEQLR